MVTSNCTAKPHHAATIQCQMLSMQHPQWSPCHVAACATMAASATIQDSTLAPDYALHGNAFNPDTGKPTEYSKLSHSSNRTMWQASNTMEIHHLAHGNDNITNTNTMFFILVMAVPCNKKATYLCIVCAHCPEKEVSIASAKLLAKTVSTMMAMLAPR